jgi:hypothetical protein
VNQLTQDDGEALHAALAPELRAAQAIANVKVRDWVAHIPVTTDSVYRILHGQRPVSLVELMLLCRVSQDDPLELISRTTTRAGILLQS